VFLCYIFGQELRSRALPLDTIKRLMSYPKCRSVEVINNPARLGSNHMEVNYIKLQIINGKELKRTFEMRY